MTSILEGPDTAGAVADKPAHAVVRFTESLAAALDRLEPVPAWSMTPAEQR